MNVNLTVSRAKVREFWTKVYPGQSWESVKELEVRAVLGGYRGDLPPEGPATSWQKVDISTDGNQAVRVVSDVDDTLKLTEVTSGMRTVFCNTFVRPYDQVVVPGTPSWLRSLYGQRVGIHYLSNAPNELQAIVSDFLLVNHFPPGHIQLKDYPSGAFDLLNAWLEPAGERKRSGLTKILCAFPHSSFILLGDAGELDLDLYTSVAMEYPHQIRAIYIRNVHTASMTSGPWKATFDALQDRNRVVLSLPANFDERRTAAAPPPPPAAYPWPALVEQYPHPGTRFSNLLATLPPPYGSAPPLYEQEGEVPGDDTAPSTTLRKKSPSELFVIRIRRAVELLPVSTLLGVYGASDPVPQTDSLDLVKRLQQQQ